MRYFALATDYDDVEFNKGAVMVLPAGVTKWTGLSAALKDLQLSAHNVVAVGDAENDHSFLAACERAVSVANALPAVRDRSDWVTTWPRGRGVTELIDRIVSDDLEGVAAKRDRPVDDGTWIHHLRTGDDST